MDAIVAIGIAAAGVICFCLGYLLREVRGPMHFHAHFYVPRQGDDEAEYDPEDYWRTGRSMEDEK